MLGYTYKDNLAKHRLESGLLDQDWFNNCGVFDAIHLRNIEHTFRLKDTTSGETNTWTPCDFWVWTENVVVFSGVWSILDRSGTISSEFDTVYISIANSKEGQMGRADLVLIDAVEAIGVTPHWLSYALEQNIAPLWWRTNKDLQWASKLIALLTRCTVKEDWAAVLDTDNLRQAVPMFDRAWSMMKTQEVVSLVPVNELPVPSWAADTE